MTPPDKLRASLRLQERPSTCYGPNSWDSRRTFGTWGETMLPYAPEFIPAVADPAAAVAPLTPAPTPDTPATAPPTHTTPLPILPEVVPSLHPGPSLSAPMDSNKVDSSAPGPSKSS